MRHARIATLFAILAVACAPAASARPAATPAQIARPLVVQFFELIQDQDVAGLKTFLSPAFQVERADGSGAGKTAYLKKLATIRKFRITKLTATRVGTTLVARYNATVEGFVNGKPYTPGPAPRLSVFHWTGKRWQLVAHANFNPLSG